jgi:hypothetical protein
VASSFASAIHVLGAFISFLLSRRLVRRGSIEFRVGVALLRNATEAPPDIHKASELEDGVQAYSSPGYTSFAEGELLGAGKKGS